MKTIKQTMTLAIATGFSVLSFAQVNLGLESTTSAAVRAAVSTATIKSTTAALNAATRSSLQTSAATTGHLISQTATGLRVAGDQTVTLAKSLKNNVMNTDAVNATAGVKVSAQTSAGGNNETNSDAADQNIYVTTSVQAEANGDATGEQAKNTSASVLSKANEKAQRGLQAATNKMKTTAAATKWAVTNTKPGVKGSVTASASEKSAATIGNR